MKNINELESYKNFSIGRIFVITFLSNLLNCVANLQEQTIEKCIAYLGVDILKNVEQNVYILNENKVALIVKVYKDNQVEALLPITLDGVKLATLDKGLLEDITASLSGSFTECYKREFRDERRTFNVLFQNKTIWKYVAQQLCSFDKFDYLIEYAKQLMLLTFENEPFSTGFILSQSIHDYKKNREHNRGGTLYALQDSLNIARKIEPDRRFWYHVDGNSSYFIFDKNLDIKSMYVAPVKDSIQDFWDEYSIKDVLWGRDLLFRTTTNKQLSIINSDGIEFLYSEGKWRLRDFKRLKLILQETTSLGNVLDSLLYFIWQCSDRRFSTIIWLPKCMDKQELSKKIVSLQGVVEEKISLKNETNKHLVMRLLSSDGVTIINGSADIIYSGCVVNLSSVQSNGLTGTGESAARLLADNGVSIKISQDGAIKVFLNKESNPYVF